MSGLTVTPEISLVDEPVKIQAWGLPADQIVTLRAWLKDEKGHMFYSSAFYMSDQEGKVDLESSPAIGGNYEGVCPMGPLWSMKPSTCFRRLIKRDVMGSPFFVHLEVYLGHELNPFPKEAPVVRKTLERWYVAPGVQRLEIRQGRVRGTLFLPPGDGPFPGVIDMFGGVGGLMEFRSSLLASRGFASLALAYFAYDDLPKTLSHVDLTYFEEAAQFLRSHPKVSGAGVGAVGTCKGAEMALAMACFLPQVLATVCINGTNAVNGNTLSYGDVHMNGIPYKVERLVVTDIGAITVTNTLEDTRKPEYQDSVLPVERARGSILFVVGEKDQNYNSLFFAEEAIARSKKYGKKDVYMHSYPGAGHLLEPPGSPFCPVSQASFLPLPVLWGGEFLSHCKAQESIWREMQDFLRKHIPCSPQGKL